MAKQKGRELLLAIWNTSAYVEIAGITAKSMTINNAMIDVTTPNPTTPGDILEAESQAGIRSFSISGDITFEDDAAFALMEVASRGNPPSELFRVTVPDYATYIATWFIESFEWSGDQEGPVKGTVTLKSSGTVTFATI